ncbi:hypothetical protein CAPTEDRAFT_221343 [Capitella teleta]|uniref:EGF-like domain-containing protein n=1 Tax=Capitella teleta TaxID=283909 RepID=R7UWJ3_CAPTE|nr:hypothetical protein CAPTEDRAFT_221343 [Capitella teleta]|eukprot:ELU07761.1 hypothetical protein CAPTEDRAFT_221343 [Capitella teleta]
MASQRVKLGPVKHQEEKTTKSLDAEIYTTRPSRCTWYKRRKVALQDLEREETRVRAAQVYEAVIQSIQHARYLTVPNGRTGKGVLGNGTIEDREVKTRLLSRREVVRCAGKCLPRTSHTFCFRAISRWLNREKKCIDFTIYRWCHFPFEPGMPQKTPVLARTSDDCSPGNQACQNGGICTLAAPNSGRDRLCVCPKGFTGESCEVNQSSDSKSMHADLMSLRENNIADLDSHVQLDLNDKGKMVIKKAGDIKNRGSNKHHGV